MPRKLRAIDWLDPPDTIQFTYKPHYPKGSVVLNSNYRVELMVSCYTLQVIYLPFIYQGKEVKLE